MKKTCKGFTISELVVALGVMGLVAAVALPTSIKNFNRHTAGATLGRAVEQVEIGCMNMIQTANDNKLDGSYGDRLSSFIIKDLDPSNNTGTSIATNPIGLGASFMGLKPDSSANLEFKTYDGKSFTLNSFTPANNSTEASFSNIYHFSKYQASLYVGYQEATPNNAEDIVADPVIIDTNGYTKPNTIGQDMFMFKLQNNCKMIPYGQEGEFDNYLTNCSDGNITDGKACAARVVADGYKVKY